MCGGRFGRYDHDEDDDEDDDDEDDDGRSHRLPKGARLDV